ncbi:phage holin family protein [Arenibaculum pallidiluteum]|uniref:phage holin family protein n=1 Tax=Arenibaculum pallidiluteum TaxID=2812559 RepID=UPI001A95799B|nr:phage holin family protein [Arenibaculum pallidiluteum]
MTAYGNDRDEPIRGETLRPEPRTTGGERPLTQLLSDLATETTTLVRKEVELARAEVSEKVGQATAGAVSLAAGGLVAFAGLIFLLLAAVYGLTRVVPDWAAALIVGAVVTLVGVVMLLVGKRKLSATSFEPRRTIETLKDDKRWAESQLGR